MTNEEGFGSNSVLPGHGLLLVDKPAGPSSAFVVAVVRRVTRVKRVGHGGTLDPFASGLLPVMVGREFTRAADDLLAGDKSYRITVRFGAETDSCDCTGRVVAVSSGPWPTAEAIRAALPAFLGESLQEPPAYSACKLDGKPLYWYARRDVAVSKPARPVRFDRLELVEVMGPDAVIDVDCGKGAYMRVLGRDLGRALGNAAHLSDLRRTRVGSWRVEDAVPLWRVQRGELPWASIGPGGTP